MAEEIRKARREIQARTLRLRDSLWEDASSRIWDYTKSDGWLNIPRAMPVILRILDILTKGKPVSATYFELWCRTFNNGFVTARPQEMAFFSGFDGERARRTWLSRIRKLQELGFIDVKAGSSGPVTYVLIVNPYPPLRKLHSDGEISEQLWNTLTARMIEIGADDLEEYVFEAENRKEPHNPQK